MHFWLFFRVTALKGCGANRGHRARSPSRIAEFASVIILYQNENQMWCTGVSESMLVVLIELPNFAGFVILYHNGVG